MTDHEAPTRQVPPGRGRNNNSTITKAMKEGARRERIEAAIHDLKSTVQRNKKDTDTKLEDIKAEQLVIEHEIHSQPCEKHSEILVSHQERLDGHKTVLQWFGGVVSAGVLALIGLVGWVWKGR